jgi:hypothetical protein
LDDSYGAVQQGLQNASPDAHAAVNAELAKLAPQLDQLPDQILDQLLQIIQYMHDNPDKYAECIKELIDAGIIDAGDFPEEYDPEFLATIGMVVMQARKTRQGAQESASAQTAPTPPATMARGGIAEAAHLVASQGRGQDTMLAHITPKEAQMLRSKGGMGTINPKTGLPEYGWLKNLVKSVGNAVGGAVKAVGNAVKEVISSPIGKVLGTVALATFLGPGAFGISGLGLGTVASMGIASGAMTALGGGSLKDVLKSAAIGGATAFFGAPGGAVSNFVGGAVTNAAANAAITSGIVGTGIGLLTGQKLQDAVKSGLTAGAISGLSTGVTQGFGSQIKAPEVPTVAEMAKGQAGENVSGKYNPETGKFELPEVVNRDTGYMQNAQATGGTEGLKPVMDPATGGVRTVAADGKAYEVYTRPDGSVAYKPVTGSGANAPAFMKGDVIPSANAPTPAPTSVDPLGDFIQQNDAQRALANTPAVGGPAGDGSYKPPTFGRAYEELGQGQYGKAAETVFMPEGPTADQVHASSSFKNAMANGADYNTAYQKAAEQMGSPGLIRSYGPAVAAGLGIAGLAGAFTPKQPQPTPFQNDLNERLAAEKARVAANPGAYVPHGLGRFGITYNDKGEITGSQPWNPQPIGPTEVAGNYMPYSPSPYMSPTGGIGSPYVAQPYNNSSMYNFMPRYAAEGGIMEVKPVHMDMGGLLGMARGGIAQATSNIAAALATSPAPAPAPAAPAPAPAAPAPAPAPVRMGPTEVTQYQQSYDPNQISNLARLLYPSLYDQNYRRSIMSNTAMGNDAGIASLATGGYPRRTGQITGPGTETSDSIPAMLSDGEFVMTAKAVRGAGKGDRLAGARKMYALMHQLENNAARG